MTMDAIVQEFRRKVCEEIQLAQEGMNRYVVSVPFTFDDGDHLCVLLKRDNGGWLLSDEGHTFMHVSYDEIDVEGKTRSKIIDNVLLNYGIQNAQGELKSVIKEDAYGDALYSFVQGLIKITDVSYLSRERVRSTFLEDFRSFIEAKIPENRRVFDYSDAQHDPQKKYVVDCRINGMKRPLFLFAINSNDRCNVATITCLHYEKFQIPFIAAAIFENQEDTNNKVLARFSDVSEKLFSSLQSAKERFDTYLKGLE